MGCVYFEARGWDWGIGFIRIGLLYMFTGSWARFWCHCPWGIGTTGRDWNNTRGGRLMMRQLFMELSNKKLNSSRSRQSQFSMREENIVACTLYSSWLIRDPQIQWLINPLSWHPDVEMVLLLGEMLSYDSVRSAVLDDFVVPSGSSEALIECHSFNVSFPPKKYRHFGNTMNTQNIYQ